MKAIYDDTVHSHVEVQSTATNVLPKQLRRLFLILQNDSDSDIYIAFGQDAVLHEGLLIPPKGNLMLDNAMITASVSAIHDGEGDKRLLITVAP